MDEKNKKIISTRNISSMFEDWFLDYASYVILERAIPNINDGLKPVQRRILHSMKEIDDSRYHKVANIIGHTMKYHPHGDQAIGDALVGIGQKDLLIDTQGNWGDFRTGDKAAAPRYIEARLTKFALDVCFNKNITKFQQSYDGRNKEPITLPVKFPLILSQGTDGIAVGLSTKILPHNFSDLIKASIAYLSDKTFTLYPDFTTGGTVDVKNYNNGKKGGKIRIRCNIDILDKDTLKISNLPYGVTTTNLIDSIVKANNSNKIKIKNVVDNTAQEIEIIINLIKGVSPNVTIDALYAFTNCEISLSPNCCIIINNKPEFISVNELLRFSTNNTVSLLESELKYKLNHLNEKLHIYTLETIFIENKIYKHIEKCESWKSVLSVIEEKMIKHSKLLNKNITDEDIVRLTEIKIKRISKFDIDKQKKLIKNIVDDIKDVQENIKNITTYSIDYFKELDNKYGKLKRNTKIEEFDSISVRRVVVANEKLYVNKKDGFVGTQLKKEEYVCKCSSIDNIIVFLQDGKYLVTKVDGKKYIGKNIIHVSVWKKNDKHMVYNVIYKDGLSKISFVKRFSVPSLIKDRLYDVTQSNPNSKILYFTANPNSESEIVSIYFHSNSKVKNKIIPYDFSNLSIKGRSAKGNILTKYNPRKIIQKQIGESTLGGRDIWIDVNIGRLNDESRGEYLGSFNTGDKIIVFYLDGSYEVTSFELSNRYKMSDIMMIDKYNSETVYTILHKIGESKKYYIKRFIIESLSYSKRFLLISESRGSKCLLLSKSKNIELTYSYRMKNNDKKSKVVIVNDFIQIKGWKALGNMVDNKRKMSSFTFKNLKIDLGNSDKQNDKDELTLFN